MPIWKNSKKPNPDNTDTDGVSPRLQRMAVRELFDYTEVCLMNAGHHLAEARTGKEGNLAFALEQAEWAVDGLRALRGS